MLFGLVARQATEHATPEGYQDGYQHGGAGPHAPEQRTGPRTLNRAVPQSAAACWCTIELTASARLALPCAARPTLLMDADTLWSDGHVIS
jgi:hypothetical protein